MPKTYTLTAENIKEIREAMKGKGNLKHYRKLEAVALRGEGKDNEEVGIITGYHPKWVSALVSIYCNEGIGGLLRDGRKGGNNRNMSKEEEEAFLNQFREAAQNGQITTVADIAAAYDEQIEKQHESKSTIYGLLQRHGWRQVMPRTQHPGKASDEVIEASKKLTTNTKRCAPIFCLSLGLKQRSG